MERWPPRVSRASINRVGNDGSEACGGRRKRKSKREATPQWSPNSVFSIHGQFPQAGRRHRDFESSVGRLLSRKPFALAKRLKSFVRETLGRQSAVERIASMGLRRTASESPPRVRPVSRETRFSRV